MAVTGMIHWHEGLFLQPHHLQTLQQYLIEQFTGERRLGWSYPYGLIEAKISDDELENMRICFDRLRIVMPSGLAVAVPENTHLPSLDIKEPFAAGRGTLTISLAVPLWYDSRANTVESGQKDEWKVKRIYRVAEIERNDENSGENPQPILLRRINARLLLDQDDRSDMEVLPLLRIVQAAGEDVGAPRRDPTFIPPCLVLEGSNVLRHLVRDLASQVQASRKELVIQLTRAGFSIDTMRGIQFEQMLRLKTLNRFSGRLPQMVHAPGISPFAFYLELRELLGELAALQPDRDLFDAPDYDHDHPAVCFTELADKIRSLLKGAVAPKFIKIPFIRDIDQKLYQTSLTDECLTLPNEYFLGIKTNQDPRALAQLVEDSDRFKLMPSSMIAQRVFGVRLAEERHPPVELPAQTGLHYFRLLRAESQRIWQRIEQEKNVSIRWPGLETADFDITLYMTVPETEVKK